MTLGDAAQRGDAKAYEKAKNKIKDTDESLRGALDNQSFSGYPGSVKDLHFGSEYEDAADTEKHAGTRVDRTARVVKTHQKEVERTRPK